MPPVSISITDNLKQRLEEYCNEIGDRRSGRSAIVSKLLTAFLDGDISIPEMPVNVEAVNNNQGQATTASTVSSDANINTDVVEELAQLRQLLEEKDQQLRSALTALEAQVSNPVGNEPNESPDLTASINASNGLALYKMMKEREKLYSILSSQKQAIKLLQAKLQEEKETHQDRQEESYARPYTLPEPEADSRRTITWFPTSDVRLEMKLVSGLPNVPLNQTFGILRSCIEVLEIQMQEQLRQNTEDPAEVTERRIQALEAIQQELVASADPSYKIDDEVYNKILDKVVRFI